MSDTHKLPRIAYFDDDASNLMLYKEILSRDFSVDTFQNPEFFSSIINPTYSAILIDVHMPGIDGIQLYHEILMHPEYNKCPIIFVSGDITENNLIRTLGVGGHDYLNRLMMREEIVARIKNKVQFFHENKQFFILGKLKIDVANLRVYFSDELVDLTMIELKILKSLVTKFPSIISREVLCQEVWPNQVVQSTTLNTHLYNLRMKFGDWEYDIQSIKTRGIQLLKKDSTL